MLRISTLKPQFSYDTECPYLKIPLGRTPHKITCHYETGQLVMATSTPIPFHLAFAKYAAGLSAGVLDDDDEDKKPRPDAIPNGRYLPVIGDYSLELVSPVTWETIDIFKLGEYEMVLCVETVTLETKHTESGNKLYVVVGTGMFRGEDLTSRGRVLFTNLDSIV